MYYDNKTFCVSMKVQYISLASFHESKKSGFASRLPHDRTKRNIKYSARNILLIKNWKLKLSDEYTRDSGGLKYEED